MAGGQEGRRAGGQKGKARRLRAEGTLIKTV
jgi:hypothetical protein